MSVDSAYRRGALLGLTIAEIFILLIFVLLLAFLGFNSRQEEDLKEREQALQELRDQEEEWKETKRERERLDTVLAVWRPVIDEFKSPEEVQTLRRRAAEIQRRVERYEDLVGEDVQTRLEELHKENVALLAENHKVREVNERLDEEIYRLSQQLSKMQEEHDTLAQDATTASQAAQKAQEALEVFRKKGENPPCWYETVPDGPGKTREKPFYTYDIAVYDDGMVVRRRQPPPGRAEDDDGLPYDEEARKHDIDQVVYDTRLTDDAVRRQLRPLHNLGKTGKVRTYPCIFFARVWDKTSPHAKARWKQAHDNVLEGLFGTYIVKDDPWPKTTRHPRYRAQPLE